MKKIIVFLAVIAFAVLLVIGPPKIYAAKGLPFGGRIVYLQPCLNGLLVVVGTPDIKSAGPYIITPATIVRAFYSPLVGNAIKGSYIPGIPCFVGPISIPTKGAITEFGTSLLPSI